MELLKTEPVRIDGPDGPEEFVLKEKDHGDMVCYDIYRQGRYLMTLAADGGILFMNFEAVEGDKELFKIPYLSQLLEKIQSSF
jgi:hypothetical protein